MLVGDIVPGIPEWIASVMVNGVERAIRSVSWDTEMTGDLPEQVIASGGLGGASGTIEWATQDAVSDRPVSPWHKPVGWPPSPGDEVRVRVSDGETTWTRFTGVIDNTTGDPTSGYQSKIIDGRDQITGSFTHEALLRHMPPLVEDGSYRSIGLNFWYPLTMALRSAGLCNVPPIEVPSALSVPFQGSVWPEAGSVRDAGGAGGTIHASFFQAEYGYAAGSLDAAYAPRLSEDTGTPVQVTVVVPDTHAGVATIDVGYGLRTIRVRVGENRGVTAFFSPTSTSPWTTVATVSAAPVGTTAVVQLLVKGGAWTLRSSAGGTGTGTQALGAGTMSSVRVVADGAARIAGVQVSHPNSNAREFASLAFSPSMRFQASGLASTMDMMPALRGRSISNLVDEILTATLTAAWWDETGTLILRPSDALRGTAPSQTITTADDITALAWEDSLLSVRSAVEVTWKDPSISKGRQYRLELWRARADTLLADSDPLEEFVTPESGVEWFGVDRTLRWLDDSNWGAYNQRRGSYCGVWYSNSNGDPITTGDARVHYSSLYADSLKITTTVVSLLSTAEVNTETHPEATALKPYLRGQALPVVRGMGRGEWVDATYRATAGPESASVLPHDLGYWGHEFFEGGSVAQRIGDYLASMVSAPQPTITDLGLIYDPRRQLGDVYTLRSEWLGIELRILVTRLSEAHGDGAHQTASVRVISATNVRGATYGEFEAAWATGNYAGLEAVWDLLTYADFEADPLRGAPA